MNARTVVSTVLRLIGIWAVVRFLVIAPSMALSFRALGGLGADWALAAYYAFAALAYLCTAACFLLLPDRIAKFIIRGGDGPVTAPIAGSESLAAMAFQCIAVYVLVNAVPDFVSGLLNMLAVDHLSFSGGTPFWIYAAAPGIRCLLGLVLFFGARDLVRLIRRAEERKSQEQREEGNSEELPPVS